MIQQHCIHLEMAPHGCFIKALYPKRDAQGLRPATEGNPISRSTMLNSRIPKPPDFQTSPVRLLPRHTNIVDMTANDTSCKYSFSPASSLASSVETITEKFDISSDNGTSPLEDILIEKMNLILTGQSFILDGLG